MPESFPIEALSSPQVLYPALAAAAALLLGLLAGCRLGRRSRLAEMHQDEHENELRDLRKTIALLQNENKNLSTFLITLPDLARQLNSNVEKRKIPQILTAFVEQLFEAQQILVFLAAPDGRTLALAGGKGIPEIVRGQDVIPFGSGRIGWVAQHQITMDLNDFEQKSRAMRGEMAATAHPLFRAELCAPMVAKNQTLGVLCLNGLLRRPKNEKNMLKMVADLGSIAMHNTVLFTQIQNSANSDGLTGLANKKHFMDRLALEINRAEKERRNLSLFLFDIDHFKSYNDTNGHLAGDEALRITGRLIKDAVRSDDAPARYGGEEFAVLLPNTDKAGALRVAEKIRRMVEAFEYPHEKSQPLGDVSISGGVATFPYDATTSGDLIRCADQALYRGKHAGRNRVFAYETKYLSDDTGTEIQQQTLADRQGM
ncbi:MAG TPA: sensor domain-containing diguanylate cyclase [Candidatus Polarisedimenticolia bacterium]|nr:sensor domain-containing diguanylate cyclase [Candidatus Polarisedimenticolia bacterium]